MSSHAPDVYTLDEVARGVGVPVAAVRTLVATGELRPLAGTEYFSTADVLRVVPALRTTAVITQPVSPTRELLSAGPGAAAIERRLPLLASIGVHACLLTAALWLTATAPRTADVRATAEPARLVFLQLPGAGGGGGGSGARARRPAPPLRRAAARPASVSTPAAALAPAPPAAEPEAQPVPPAPPVPAAAPAPPLPAPPAEVIAPIAPTAARVDDTEGVRGAPPAQDSRGPGAGGRSGSGSGTGSGEGLGSGIGDGAGGGIGGGPYRPGAGIEPPRLLREVKAEYTEEARRRGITGSVLLEIVVTRQGSVGSISVTRGLGLGLDQRAIDAVRRWQFAPARRQGQPVDVLVEVAVEFKLR